MTKEDRRQVDSLDRRLEALRLDATPQRDLWPGIASRIGSRPPAREARAEGRGLSQWLPVGAALVAGYLIASFIPLPWGGGVVQPAAETGVAASADLLASVQPALQWLPAKTRAVVEVDLSALEQDRLSIEEALAADPNNPLLEELHANAIARAASLTEQMNRLAGATAAGELEM